MMEVRLDPGQVAPSADLAVVMLVDQAADLDKIVVYDI